MLVPPHGGRLVDRQLDEDQATDLIESAESLGSLTLNERERNDLEMIGNGAMSPLEGFMGRHDYRSVVDLMHLSSGPGWSIPITLSTKSDDPEVSPGDRVALRDEEGLLWGDMLVEDVFQADLEAEAEKVLGTKDPSHPGVAYLEGLSGTYVGGAVRSIRRREWEEFARYRLDPKETRVLFRARGWNTVVAFQTRNPVHRAHEYIQKCALEMVDGLLLHPLVGQTKKGDVPAEVRMFCYETILRCYYPETRVTMSVFPSAMRYAGPREAVLHAIMRKNYGCSHFIVGRDHAGVGDFYGTYDAQMIFDRFDADELGIVPLKFEHAFYCRKCQGMATMKTCPHDSNQHVFLSGTRVREMLGRGELPPPEFTRPEIAEILLESMKSRESE
ncbi:sulfate adenylyltransferase [Candidatus Fermentibacteria bacterium]|nr:sulfate adenylyltransferase [Candidatus Fermentibacteria bacterium]